MKEKVQMLTLKEAADLIYGISEYRLRKMCVNGEITCFKAGNRYLINKENLIKCFS